MKYLSLLMWVGQFGFSALFPMCVFLIFANWLRQTYHLGLWVTVVLGLLGLLTSFSTAKSCLQSMQKEIARIDPKEKPPVAFNDHT